MKTDPAIVAWLLESENPSVRYRTLTELLGRPRDDSEALHAKAAVLESKPVRRIFAKMHPEGFWLCRGLGAGVSYAMSGSTHFVLSYLAELGLDREDERVARAVERYLSLRESDKPEPNLWEIPPDFRNHQSCLYAYNIRTFVKLGYRDDPRILERIKALLSDVRFDGGYLCDRPSFTPKTRSCIRGSVKALMAFSELPCLWRSDRCLKLVEYFLSRRVIYKKRRPGELIRGEMAATVFPFVIGGSLLEPLYALSRMGYGRDSALADAWRLLKAKRGHDGRFSLDHAPQNVFDAGQKGQPNKWITLYACLADESAGVLSGRFSYGVGLDRPFP